MKRDVLLRAIIGIALVGALPAAAQEVPPTVAQASENEGRLAFARGIEAIGQRRFADAEVALRRAVTLRPTPLAFYNLALALRALSRTAESIEYFDRYLAQPEEGAQPARIQAVRTEVSVMRSALPRVELTVTPADALVRLDGRPIAPGTRTFPVDPGQHVLEITAEGHNPEQRTFAVASGGQFVATITLTAVVVEGTIEVVPTTSHAEVTIDGRSVGRGRTRTSVTPGDHVVEVRAPDHIPWRRTVTVAAHGTVRVDSTLQPEHRGMPGWVLPTAIGAGVVVVGAVVAGVLIGTSSTEEPYAANWGNFRP